MKIMFLANGCSAAFDEKGKQIQGIAKPWLLLYVKYLQALGYDPLSVEFELPNHQTAKLFNTENGYNWGIS